MVNIMHFARLQELYTQKAYTVLPIKSGMMLELHENVGEGDTKRIQKFKWLVIQVKKPNHPDGTFTIRGTVAGLIVEKIFPLSFTKFEKVILLDQFKTRRSRINYIREKVGKDARMKSIVTVDIKETDLLAGLRPVVEEVAEPTVEETPVVQTPVVEEAPATEPTPEAVDTAEVATSEEAPAAEETTETKE